MTEAHIVGICNYYLLTSTGSEVLVTGEIIHFLFLGFFFFFPVELKDYKAVELCYRIIVLQNHNVSPVPCFHAAVCFRSMLVQNEYDQALAYGCISISK